MAHYLTKVLIAVEANTLAEAGDAISECLRDKVFDWAYSSAQLQAVTPLVYEDGHLHDAWDAAKKAVVADANKDGQPSGFDVSLLSRFD